VNRTKLPLVPPGTTSSRFDFLAWNVLPSSSSPNRDKRELS
jgi:hypothetical protein